jgi:hypothetical protein
LLLHGTCLAVEADVNEQSIAATLLLDDRVYPVVRSNRSGVLYVRYRFGYYVPIYGGHRQTSGQFWSHGGFRNMWKYRLVGVAKKSSMDRSWTVNLCEEERLKA